MIAKLSGRLDSIGTDSVVVDVGGVGYLVFCSARTLRRLGAVGEAASLAIETHVREDAINLYGFFDTVERDWFRLLTTVQGVGARVALALLSVLSPDQLTLAISAQDRTMLTQADGVGPKLANRIMSELKDKVGALKADAGVVVSAAVSPVGEPVGRSTADAVSALVNLGYRRAEAFGAVATAAQRLGQDADVSELIRAALKELSA